MKLDSQQKWIRVRKELFRHIEGQVKWRLGEDSPGMAAYKKAYEREFLGRWVAIENQDFIAEVAQSDVILMGDFHALQQSQKAQLRILKALPEKMPLVLAVEFFEAEHQEVLEKHLKGKLSEREFLKAIRWSQRWGFPWDHYRPLIRWAQKNKIPIYGLNKYSDKRTSQSLKKRDQFAAEQIKQIRQQHPQRKVFVIYGDLHLAQEHLPKEILRRTTGKQKIKLCRIFQNSEKIYFQLLARGLENSVDVVKLRQGDYCLLSVPPWVKWQNYLMFLEQNYDLEIDDESLDFADHTLRLLQMLEGEIGIQVGWNDLSVFTAQESSLWAKLKARFKESELKAIEYRIESSQSFYLPELELGYLGRVSVNSLAALAMQYLHSKSAKFNHSFLKSPDCFLRMIWIECVAYFGSKLVNPKRKTDTISDIKSNLMSRNPIEIAKEPLQLALVQKMIEIQWMSGAKRKKLDFKAKSKNSYFEAARLLGGILGEKLYLGYRRGMISSAVLNKWLKTPLDGIDFEAFYYENLEVIDHLPASFQSKKEKM